MGSSEDQDKTEAESNQPDASGDPEDVAEVLEGSAETDQPDETRKTEETADDGSEDEEQHGPRSVENLIESINFKFQRLYGNVTLLVLAIWVAMVVSAWLTIDQGWTVAIIGIGSALLGLFALRATVHVRSTPLLAEVDDFRDQRDLSMDELIEIASRMSPPADFFVSLVDGPMARQRRQRQTQTDDA